MEDAPRAEVRLTAAADWAERRHGTGSRALAILDAATAAAERPVARAGGSIGINPLHHTGPIAVFLFLVACATGVYVTMFYRFGFEASYEAVAALEESLPGRLMRAGHRCSSIALVAVSLLHGWRTFVTKRFQKPRRTAWVTGTVMVAIIWPIGVTGYWLIWDERAQVLNEALRRVAATWTSGLDFMIDTVLTDAAGTGWAFLLLLFLVHFFLSLVVAVLIWYHLRHLARPAWLPTAFLTALIGGSLFAAAAAFPVGMLPAVDPARLIGRLNFDPFFLFLLPPALRWQPALLWSSALIVSAVVVGLPWLLLRGRPRPVQVLADRCIGCTWCVADCPYGAVTMAEGATGSAVAVAVVDPARCVSCGICLGSCPTRALALEGREPGLLWEDLGAGAVEGGNSVTITCQRHIELGGGDAATLAVPCVGMVPPSLLEAAADDGITLELVACPRTDCSYREGSGHLQDRLEGKRPPRLRPAYAGADVVMHRVAPGRFDDRRDLPPPQPPTPRRTLPLAGIIAATALASVLISQAVFDVGDGQRAAVTVSLDHRAGIPLEGEPIVTDAAPTGEPPRLTVVIDGEIRFDETIGLRDADDPNTALLWRQLSVAPGIHEVTVQLADDPAEPARTLFADTVALQPGERLLLQYRDQAIVDPVEAGRELFTSRTRGTRSGCVICHSLEPGVRLVGPSLAGVATRAASTVPGFDAAEYLRQSIVDPDAYVVPGFAAGQMLSGLGDLRSATELDQLVAFLLTLEER